MAVWIPSRIRFTLLLLTAVLSCKSQAITGAIDVINQKNCSDVRLTSHSCVMSCSRCLQSDDLTGDPVVDVPLDLPMDSADTLTSYTALRTTAAGEEVCTLVIRGSHNEELICDGSDHIMWLDISGLKFDYNLEKWVLTSLQYLDMSRTGKENLGDSIVHFTHLTFFIAKNNEFRSIDRDFRHNHELRYIDLSENKIMHISPNAFSDMPKLTWLDLSQNFVRGIDLATNTATLYLILADNKLTDEWIRNRVTGRLCSLQTLELNVTGNPALSSAGFISLFGHCNDSETSVVVHMDSDDASCFVLRGDEPCSSLQFLKPGCTSQPRCVSGSAEPLPLQHWTPKMIAATAAPSGLVVLLVLVLLMTLLRRRKRNTAETSSDRGVSTADYYTPLDIVGTKSSALSGTKEVAMNRDSGIDSTEPTGSGWSGGGMTGGATTGGTSGGTSGPPLPFRKQSLAPSMSKGRISNRPRTESEGDANGTLSDADYQRNWRNVLCPTDSVRTFTTHSSYLETGEVNQPNSMWNGFSHTYDDALNASVAYPDGLINPAGSQSIPVKRKIHFPSQRGMQSVDKFSSVGRRASPAKHAPEVAPKPALKARPHGTDQPANNPLAGEIFLQATKTRLQPSSTGTRDEPSFSTFGRSQKMWPKPAEMDTSTRAVQASGGEISGHNDDTGNFYEDSIAAGSLRHIYDNRAFGLVHVV